MGNAAFLAGSPVLGSERLHRQRVDFLAHPVAKHAVDGLVLLDPALAAKLGADDDCLEMMAVAGHFDVVAGKLFLDVGLDLFGGNHLVRSGQLVGAPQWRSL
jgi:hypothetical protein